MTPSDLKLLYQTHNPEGHFFDRRTLAFFGDTMKNYGVRTCEVDSTAWELYRKRRTPKGHWKSAYFDKVTFKERHDIAMKVDKLCATK